MKTCENKVYVNDDFVLCGKVAIGEHWDCCGGYWGVPVCADCLPEMETGDSTMCDWYNLVDGVVVSSSNPAEVGVSYN